MDQKQPEKKKYGKRYALVGGVLIMLVACFLLGVLVGQQDGEPETALVSASPGPTGTATQGDALEGVSSASTALAFTSTAITLEALEPTLTATPRPTLTATPEPTETPEPTPTATPHPTLTATPVPTATAVRTVAGLPTLTRLGWTQETRPQLKIIADASLTMGSLMMKPLLGDATWTALVRAQVVRMREADAALIEIVPPEECREAHEMLLFATGDLILGVEYALEGAIEQDRDLLEQATEYIASGDAKFNLFVLMVEAMNP